MKYLNLIFSVSFIFILQTACQKEKKKQEAVYSDPAYAIGEITHWVNITVSTTYHYQFSANGEVVKSKQRARFGNRIDERFLAADYLVVYSKTDPDQSVLHFEYPIENQQAFDSLLIEFENDPPGR